MGEPTDSIYDSKPIADSMPPIPIFEPAPAPKPVVTDTMPPIPVTAPAPAPVPAKPAGMPPINARPIQAQPIQPTQSAQPIQPRPMQPVQPQPVRSMNPAMQSAPAITTTPQAPVTPAITPEPAAPIQPRPVAPVPPAAPAMNTMPAQPSMPAANPMAPNNAAPIANAAPVNPETINQPAPIFSPNKSFNNPFMPTPKPAAAPLPPTENPFVEAAAKNREIHNVSFSSIDETPAKAPAKFNKKFIIIAGAALVLLLVVVIVMVMGNSGSKPTTNPTPTPSKTETSKAGTYICEREYLESEFDKFGSSIVSAKDTVKFVYTSTGFDSISKTTAVTYDDGDALKASYSTIKSEYDALVESLSLSADPFDTSYSRNQNTLEILRASTIVGLDASALSLIDLTTTVAPYSLTSDDLQDLLEADNYSCRSVVDVADTTE